MRPARDMWDQMGQRCFGAPKQGARLLFKYSAQWRVEWPMNLPAFNPLSTGVHAAARYHYAGTSRSPGCDSHLLVDREAEELGGCAPGLRGAWSAVPFITMSHFLMGDENLGEIHRAQANGLSHFQLLLGGSRLSGVALLKSGLSRVTAQTFH